MIVTRKQNLILLAAFTAATAFAAPNFSGSWKLQTDKSDFGPMPAPEKMEQVIEHKDPDMKIKLSQSGAQGEFNMDFNYSTDGKETKNELRGNPMKSKGKWDGDVLVIDSKLDFQGNEVGLSDKYTLSADGKTLTIARKINSPQGELEQKMVLAKQ